MPQTHGTAAIVERLTAQLVSEAEAEHAAYPQYAGHWVGWRLVEVTKRVRTKMGVAFEPGDLALCAPSTHAVGNRLFVTCYSRRNRIDTSIPAGSTREIRITQEG